MLEKKAAANALELLQRLPAAVQEGDAELFLAGVARDETLHLLQVLRLMRARGARLPGVHRNRYARDLRARVRTGRGPEEIADRFFVSALIEARSCERLGVLARCCPDREVGRFWQELCASERGHFAGFVRLAQRAAGAGADARWAWWLGEEAAVLAEQPPGIRIHSGLAAR